MQSIPADGVGHNFGLATTPLSERSGPAIDLAITELEVGGAERCLTQLACGLAARGWQVRVICIGPLPSPPRDALLVQLRSAGVQVESLGARGAVELPRVWWRWRSLVKRQRPQLAQAFLHHANVLSASVYPALRIPLLGGLRVAQPSAVRLRLGHWAAGRMRYVVCVSRSVAEWFTAGRPELAESVVVIPNGVSVPPPDGSSLDESMAQPAEAYLRDRGVSGDAPVLLCLGRLDHQKGTDRWIELGDTLLERLPRHHLVLVGDGPLAGDASAWRERSPNRTRVHLPGWQPDPRAWLRRGQLLALPTRYEGMPNVLLEAMAEGRAVALPRVEGVREVLGAAAEDQSVLPGDMAAWFELVCRLANDPQRCQQLGAANQLRCRAEFSWERMIERYQRLYLASLGRPEV
jgi:glycosyltransferase involved in cell wall biosynthesis